MNILGVLNSVMIKEHGRINLLACEDNKFEKELELSSWFFFCDMLMEIASSLEFYFVVFFVAVKP